MDFRQGNMLSRLVLVWHGSCTTVERHYLLLQQVFKWSCTRKSAERERFVRAFAGKLGQLRQLCRFYRASRKSEQLQTDE